MKPYYNKSGRTQCLDDVGSYHKQAVNRILLHFKPIFYTMTFSFRFYIVHLQSSCSVAARLSSRPPSFLQISLLALVYMFMTCCEIFAALSVNLLSNKVEIDVLIDDIWITLPLLCCIEALCHCCVAA